LFYSWYSTVPHLFFLLNNQTHRSTHHPSSNRNRFSQLFCTTLRVTSLAVISLNCLVVAARWRRIDWKVITWTPGTGAKVYEISPCGQRTGHVLGTCCSRTSTLISDAMGHIPCQLDGGCDAGSGPCGRRLRLRFASNTRRFQALNSATCKQNCSMWLSSCCVLSNTFAFNVVPSKRSTHLFALIVVIVMVSSAATCTAELGPPSLFEGIL
jgi:hypothetical protein